MMAVDCMRWWWLKVERCLMMDLPISFGGKNLKLTVQWTATNPN